jgi:hypothetical protein
MWRNFSELLIEKRVGKLKRLAKADLGADAAKALTLFAVCETKRGAANGGFL